MRVLLFTLGLCCLICTILAGRTRDWIMTPLFAVLTAFCFIVSLFVPEPL